MQLSRLFEIVYILLNREQVTAKELAERFEVSTRTIYRDIDALGAAGVPVHTFKGKGGGIRLMEGYVLGRSMLSEQEQHGILSALQGLGAVGAADADKLLSKLNALFRRDVDNWIQVDFTDWGGMNADVFDRLRSAILTHREVRFTYHSSAGQRSERTVRPLQLWFKHRGWYLRAHCLTRGGERLFRLSRLRDLQVSDREFEPQPQTSQPQPPSSAPQSAPPPGLTLRLRVHPSQTHRVLDEFAPGQVQEDEDGFFLIEQSYPEDEWVYGLLLSFGGSLEVLEPARVRDELSRRAIAILEQYMKI